MNKSFYIFMFIIAVVILPAVGCRTPVEKAVLRERELLSGRLKKLQAENAVFLKQLNDTRRKNTEYLNKIQRNVEGIAYIRNRSHIFWKNHSKVMMYDEKDSRSINKNIIDVMIPLGDAITKPIVEKEKGIGLQCDMPYAEMPILTLPQEEEYCIIADMGIGPWKDEYELYAFEVLLAGNDINEIALVIIDENNNVTDSQSFMIDGSSMVSWIDVNYILKWKRLCIFFGGEIGSIKLPANHRWGLKVPRNAKLPCNYLGLPSFSQNKGIGIDVQVAPFKKDEKLIFSTPKAEYMEQDYPKDANISDVMRGAIISDHKKENEPNINKIMTELKPSVSMAVYGTVTSNK